MASKTMIATPVLMEEPGAAANAKLDGSDLQVGLVYTRHCKEVVDAMVMACRGELLLKGVVRSHIHELEVSQPYDIPYAVKRMLQSAPVALDAVVCIGCLVRGESLAYDFVAEAVTRACMKLGMKMKTPVIYGVLTCTDEQQARHFAGLHERSKVRTCNFGVEWAQSAIDMGHMNRKATQNMVGLCECSCHGSTKSECGTCETGDPQGRHGTIASAFTPLGYPRVTPCGSCGHKDQDVGGCTH